MQSPGATAHDDYLLEAERECRGRRLADERGGNPSIRPTRSNQHNLRVHLDRVLEADQSRNIVDDPMWSRGSVIDLLGYSETPQVPQIVAFQLARVEWSPMNVAVFGRRHRARNRSEAVPTR